MPCPNCNKRLPREVHTICPNCGFVLSQRRADFQPSTKDHDELRNISKRRNGRDALGYLALFFGCFALSGFVLDIVIIPLGRSTFPVLNNPSLPTSGLVIGFSGLFVLAGIMASWSFSHIYGSRSRHQRGEKLSVWDAMTVGVYFPNWMEPWMPIIPAAVFLVLGYAKIIPIGLGWFLFILYVILIFVYQYLYAKRWVAKHQ